MDAFLAFDDRRLARPMEAMKRYSARLNGVEPRISSWTKRTGGMAPAGDGGTPKDVFQSCLEHAQVHLPHHAPFDAEPQ